MIVRIIRQYRFAASPTVAASKAGALGRALNERALELGLRDPDVHVMAWADDDGPDVRVQSVGRCARCNGDHRHVAFTRLEHPVPDVEVVGGWTHWAPCPANGQPILLAVRKTSEVFACAR